MMDISVDSKMPHARIVANILTGIHNTAVRRLSFTKKSCIQKKVSL
jgi:hypothetical protein